MALHTTFCRWGWILVPPGYLDPIQFEVGKPYGASHVSANGQNPVGEAERQSVPFPARRAVQTAIRLKQGARAAWEPPRRPGGVHDRTDPWRRSR